MRGAIIDFAGDHSIMVDETPTEVESVVKKALQTGLPPLLHFRTRYGDQVIANPAQICMIREQPDFDRPVG